MQLTRQFPDKYAAWSHVLRGQTDQAFFPTAEKPPIGAPVSVLLSLPQLVGPLPLYGVVTGYRPPGARLAGGVYVSFPDSELEKCRELLGLSPRSIWRRARKNRRVPCELTAELIDPPLPQSCSVRNLSESGLQAVLPFTLVRGGVVELRLVLDNGAPLRAKAEVCWSGAGGLAGLRFTEPDQCRALIERCLSRLAQKDAAQRGGAVVIADASPSRATDLAVLLHDWLRRHHFDVCLAAQTGEAMRLIKAVRPNLVILDPLMPTLDANRLCHTLRTDIELCDIPVLLVAAMSESALHALADEAGATDYLPKPVVQSDLLNLVGHYLAQRPA